MDRVAATTIIYSIYKNINKWNSKSVFVGIHMGDCIVYTPVSRLIGGATVILFKARLEELYKYTQKTLVDKVVKN